MTRRKEKGLEKSVNHFIWFINKDALSPVKLSDKQKGCKNKGDVTFSSLQIVIVPFLTLLLSYIHPLLYICISITSLEPPPPTLVHYH